ncbi:hypothetical protein GCM10022215_04520 [Nocardioides fonticola]|uniref:Secreted protein n=1 Tax=Nocardioides fonticola TaxID=450363 RepID=A0ABP7XAW2_9ACTN
MHLSARPSLAAVAAASLGALGALAAVPHADAATTGISTASAGDVRVVTYKGDGVSVRRASHQLGRLADTSKDFQLAVKKGLDDLWTEDNGGKASCATAPVVVVKKWRSDGWATLTDIGTFAPCPTGGHQAIWRTIDGTWTEILGTQEVPKCSKLRKLEVPKNMWKQCYAGGKVVAYTGP